MKRYGFKFYTMKDGTKTKAIDLRYYSVLGGCFFSFFASMFNPGHVGLVVVSIPIFLLLGFFSERWPQIFFYMTGFVATISLSLVFWFEGDSATFLDWLIGTILTEIYFSIYVLISVQGYRRES